MVQDHEGKIFKNTRDIWHHNGGRPRENLDRCPVHACKDENGNWTRWVLERLDENQMKVYEQYREILKDEPLLDWMSENYHMRFL